MSSLHGQFQEAFARALLEPERDVASEVRELVMQPAFAVYRNTVMKSCIDALEANFPAVARLVGREWFRAAAALYVAGDAPRDACLLRYGNGFADFLHDFGPAAELGYLPGVARLDTFWREAHVARDALAADAAWVAGQSPERMATLILRPHPAARWAWFDNLPVYSIWDSNRRPDEIAAELTWRGEGALIARPDDIVHWHPITKAGCTFLDACADGVDLAGASQRALASDPEADLAQIFSTLLRVGALADASTSPTSDERAP
jgi:hypothetical protein